MTPEKTVLTNIEIGKGQDEYTTLPAHAVPGPMGNRVYLLRLEPEDWKNLERTGGQIWIVQSTFNQNFQPIRVETLPPYEAPYDDPKRFGNEARK